MFCEVECIYVLGQKWPEPRHKVRGELTLHKWKDGSNRGPMRLRADLQGPDREPATYPMIDATVVRITPGGLVITGTELWTKTKSSKANVEYYPQVWWCRFLPGAMEYLPEKPPEVPGWRKAFMHP